MVTRADALLLASLALVGLLRLAVREREVARIEIELIVGQPPAAAEHRLGLLLVRVRGLAVGLRRVGVRAGLLRGRGGIRVSVGGRVRVGG